MASLCGLLIIWPLMELWDVPGYADRLEDEMISDYVAKRQAVGDTRDAQALTNTTTSTTPSGRISR